jgi:hypothetical protein
VKLRFHADTLRLRLSQSDIARLASTGRVEEMVSFAPGRILSYAIESGNWNSITATFDGERVAVQLPSMVAKTWIESDQESLEGAGGLLRVLVEKDFQCLHRDSPQDADSFPNPLAHKD